MNSSAMDIYHKMLHDKSILKKYEEVFLYEKKTGGWATHNFSHVQNVTNMVEQILSGFNYEEEFIYKAKIACLLHDVGAYLGKENHALRSYEFAKDYFSFHHIDFTDIDMVLEAIKIHSDGFNTDNVIALALILADKLDVKKTRITDAGKKVIGNRQYAHIEDIVLKIDGGTLNIYFVTDGHLDKKELEEYYFTKKMVLAVDSFASKFHLQHAIYLDNKRWK